MSMPMAGEAMQIVNKSLETGARGYTQKETDYSGLSDAFMKKASLETQIGGMMMENNMQRANLLSNLELSKADIYMKGAELAQREDHFNREMKAREDADKMSPFEQITGVLAGAAGPAAAGFAVGGPVGAVVGGVAGGAMTASAGNSRSRQQNIIGNLGAISQAAVAIKGFSNAGKAADSTNEMIKGVNSISGIFRTAAPNSEEFQGAQAQLDNYIGKYTQEQIKLGRPMGEVYKEAAALKKEAMQGFDPNDKEMVANRNIQGLIAEAKTDPAFMRGDRKAIKNFQMQAAGFHMEAYGKAPTNADMQVYTGRVDADVAASFYRNPKSVSSMPAPNPNAGSGGGQVSSQSGGSSAQGVTKTVTGMSGSNTTYNTPPVYSQDGGTRMNPGMGVMAPSAPSQAWGVDMDHGPEQMVADASANFNEAASKDPTIIDKALNREPQGPGFVESRIRSLQENFTFPGSDKFGPLREGGALDKMADKRESARKYNNMDQSPMQVATTETGTSEPNITTTDPAVQQKEYKFKTITSVDQMKKEMKLEGIQFKKEGDRTLVMGTAQAAAELNAFEKDILSPENRAIVDSLDPEARKEIVQWAEGMGADAMKGSSNNVAVSGTGASAQISHSEFERSNKIALEKIGERHNLSKEQTAYLHKLRTRVEGIARTVAMSKNKGQLTDADVSPWRASVANIFEGDSAVGASGLNPVRDMLWNTFYMQADTVETIGQEQERKNRNKSPGRIENTADDPWMAY